MEYEKLTLSNDFIFAKVMQDKALCKKLLELILMIKISDIVYHEEQKVLEDSPDGKAVRLDVYVEDDQHSVFDIEMQTTDTGELPKRSRYYQGRIDVDILDKGTTITYKDLKASYIIFICLEDIFGAGRHIYSFENTCSEDPSIKLNDGAIKVYLNADSDLDDVDEELANFLNYLKSGKPADDFTLELDKSVRFARTNKDWKEEFRDMNMQRRLWEEKGRTEERKLVFVGLIKDGILTLTEAASRSQLPIEDLEKALEEDKRIHA